MAEFVQLKRFPSGFEAQIVVGILESNGIRAILAPEHDGAPRYLATNGSTRVLVPLELLAQARQLVEADLPIPAQSSSPAAQALPIAEGSGAPEPGREGSGRVVPRRKGFRPKRSP